MIERRVFGCSCFAFSASSASSLPQLAKTQRQHDGQRHCTRSHHHATPSTLGTRIIAPCLAPGSQRSGEGSASQRRWDAAEMQPDGGSARIPPLRRLERVMALAAQHRVPCPILDLEAAALELAAGATSGPQPPKANQDIPPPPRREVEPQHISARRSGGGIIPATQTRDVLVCVGVPQPGDSPCARCSSLSLLCSPSRSRSSRVRRSPDFAVRKQVSADTARKLVEACVAYAKARNPIVGVAVVDIAGVLLDMH